MVVMGATIQFSMACTSCGGGEASFSASIKQYRYFGSNTYVQDPGEDFVAVLPCVHDVLDSRDLRYGSVLLDGGFDLLTSHAPNVAVPPDPRTGYTTGPAKSERRADSMRAQESE